MRIFHVTRSAGEATLGTEKGVADLAVAQTARGSDVMIAIDSQGVFTEACRKSGIPITVHDRLRVSTEILIGAGPEENAIIENAVQGLIERIECFSPDIIHCHSPSVLIVGVGAANQMDIPCAYDGGNLMGTMIGRRRGLRFATLCNTMATVDALLKNGVPDTEAYHVPLGIRVAPPAKVQQAGASHPPNLIMAANLEQKKGVDILILAMAELRRRLGEACPFLNIYGDGPRRNHLAEMATVLGLNDIVQFHGFVARILETCSSSDVLVMPARWESGPMTVLEAMSRGMPIVATDVGDVTNMLPDSRYGRIVPPDSVMPLADAIESLLADLAEGRHNPDLLIDRYRSFYTIDNWAERLEVAYSQILLNSSVTVQPVE